MKTKEASIIIYATWLDVQGQFLATERLVNYLCVAKGLKMNNSRIYPFRYAYGMEDSNLINITKIF